MSGGGGGGHGGGEVDGPLSRERLGREKGGVRGAGGSGGCFGRRPDPTDGRSRQRKEKRTAGGGLFEGGRKGGWAAASVSGRKGAKKNGPATCKQKRHQSRVGFRPAGAPRPCWRAAKDPAARASALLSKPTVAPARAAVPGPINRLRRCEAHRAGNGPSPWATATLSAPRKTGPRHCCSTGKIGGVGALHRKSFGATLPWGKNGEPRRVTP